MKPTKNYAGYKSFQYLESDVDYPHFDLAPELDRVKSTKVQLEEDQEEKVARILSAIFHAVWFAYLSSHRV